MAGIKISFFYAPHSESSFCSFIAFHIFCLTVQTLFSSSFFIFFNPSQYRKENADIETTPAKKEG